MREGLWYNARTNELVHIVAISSTGITQWSDGTGEYYMLQCVTRRGSRFYTYIGEV